MNQAAGGDLLAGHPVLDADLLSGFHLLEADAGTGKTWTIARLVLRAILERDLSINQIVVVTFTKAAAAELKDRVARLLDAWSQGIPTDEDPFSTAYQLPIPQEDLIRKVRQARLQLDDAPILTIHGFCQRILTEQSLSLGQWGEFEPGYDDSAALTEAVAHWWRANIVHGDARHSLLIGRHGLSFERLVGVLAAAQSCPDAVILGHRETDWLTLADRLNRQVEQIRRLLGEQRDELTTWLQDKSSLNQSSYPSDKTESRLNELAAWLEQFPMSIDSDVPSLALFDSRRIALKKGAVDRRDQFSVLAAVAGLNDLRIERSYIALTVATQIRGQIDMRLDQHKRDARQITYDDLLNRTRRALEQPGEGEMLAAALALRFPLALIDEFQDTDPAQWAIFSQIYRPGDDGPASSRTDCGLVLVGDPKQAIYSFRHADVQTYLHARGQGAQTHRLGQNQRSSRGLIDAVNRLFERDQPFANALIPFAPAQAGAAADNSARAAPDDDQGALCFVQLSGVDGPDPQATAKPILNERAAQICSQQIQRLLVPQVPGGQAPVEPGEIAVIVRKLDQGRLIKEQLARAGIGAVEVSRNSVLLSDEASDLLRVLEAIAGPSDDRLVRGALLTTLLGFGVDDLENMDAEPVLWDRRFQAFETCQRHWLRQGPEASLRDLIFGFYDRAARLVSLSGGERRMTNLLHLFELLGASDVARESAGQARAMLSRQRQNAIENRERDEATELRLESDDQLVRILTIHGSKGLEFPVVFLPFAWSGSPLQSNDVLIAGAGDSQPRRITLRHALELFRHPNWQIAPDGADSPLRIADQLNELNAQENLRLTYVALTRASRRCYVYWAYPETLRGSELAPIRVEASGIGYLLDGQSQLSGKPDVGRVNERLRTLADEQPGMSLRSWLSIDSADAANGRPVAGLPGADVSGVVRNGWPAPAQMTLARFDGSIAPAWWTSSFTSLMAQAGQPTSEAEQGVGLRPDHDQLLGRELIAPGDLQASDVRSRFVRGANAGSCLHQILEQLDFRDPVPPELVARTLDRFNISQADHRPDQIAQWLEQVLAAPLADPRGEGQVALSRVAPEDAISELDYLMPMRSATAMSLAETVRGEYDLPAQLSAARISGFMTGFIDLVFRADDVYYLVDWKSNWLGENASAYTPPAMARSIAEHGYALQFCLYSLALHRWLRARLPGYEIERHFGGVHYVFLRGAGVSGQTDGHGIFSTRPSRRLIDAMDGLLDGEAG